MQLIATLRNYSISIDHSGANPVVEAVLICSQADYEIKKKSVTKVAKLESIRFSMTLAGAESLAADLATWISNLRELEAGMKVEVKE